VPAPHGPELRAPSRAASEAASARAEAQSRGVVALPASTRGAGRELFGDAVLGATNLRLVDIATEHGGVAKFPGSGGAVVGTCEPDALEAIRAAYERESFVFVVIKPHWPDDAEELGLAELAVV